MLTKHSDGSRQNDRLESLQSELSTNGPYTHTYAVQHAVCNELCTVSFLLPPVHLMCAKHTAVVHQAALEQHGAAITFGVIFAARCLQLCWENPNNDIIQGFPKQVFSHLCYGVHVHGTVGTNQKTKIDTKSLIIEIQKEPFAIWRWTSLLLGCRKTGNLSTAIGVVLEVCGKVYATKLYGSLLVQYTSMFVIFHLLCPRLKNINRVLVNLYRSNFG